jgi:hypothetical protein
LWPGNCPPSPGFAPCALAGVGLAADAVHRDRQGRVRFPADRAEAHRAGRKALDDRGGRLDLLERHRGVGEFEAHQPAQGQKPLALIVDQRGEGAVFLAGIAAHRVLQPRHRLRRPGVVLAAQAIGVVAAGVEQIAIEKVLAVGAPVPRHRLLGDLDEPHALHRRRRSGEIFVDKIALKPHRVEDLRPAIGLIGRDAHLGHHLKDALAERFQIVFLGLFGGERQSVREADLLDRGEGEIGVDRLRTVTGQRAEMMHFARLAGLDDDAGHRAQALADQVMMHRRSGEQGRDRHAFG